MATDACKKGQVTMNGATMKPSKTIKEGDVVSVRKPPITYTFRVLKAIENRVGVIDFTSVTEFTSLMIPTSCGSIT